MTEPAVTLLRALAHPLRLRVVDRLGHLGPASVSALAVELGAPLPELSNHLKRLRDAGLVTARRDGRHAVYELSGTVDALLPLLDRLTRPDDPTPLRAPSRTCYDHLAGPLGVELYHGLLSSRALRARADGTVEIVDPGPLAQLGVGDVEPGRRRLAFECLDTTEHAPHLAGRSAARWPPGCSNEAGSNEARTARSGSPTPGGAACRPLASRCHRDPERSLTDVGRGSNDDLDRSPPS